MTTPVSGFSTISEPASRAKISVGSLRREISEGRIRTQRIARVDRIRADELTRWMRGQPIPVDTTSAEDRTTVAEPKKNSIKLSNLSDEKLQRLEELLTVLQDAVADL